MKRRNQKGKEERRRVGGEGEERMGLPFLGHTSVSLLLQASFPQKQVLTEERKERRDERKREREG